MVLCYPVFIFFNAQNFFSGEFEYKLLIFKLGIQFFQESVFYDYKTKKLILAVFIPFFMQKLP